MKIIMTIISTLLFASCLGDVITGEIVKMPKGYSIKQTDAFLKKILNNELKTKMLTKFPNITKQKKGGFRYQPIIMKSIMATGVKVGVILKIHGFEGWDKRSEFKAFLLSYLKDEVKKIMKVTTNQKNSPKSATTSQ